MKSGNPWKILGVVGSLILALYFLMPSFLQLNEKRQAAQESGKTLPWYYRIFPDQQIKLGLDLQGGIHLVMGIDVDKAIVGQLQILANDLEEDFERQEFSAQDIEIDEENFSLHIVFNEYKGADLDMKSFNDLRLKLRKRYSFLEFEPDDQGFGITVRYKKEELKFIRKNTVDQALLVLRNRIDEYGVNEPNITSQGDDRILIQLPGVKDPERAKQLIGRTAQLTFQIVEDAQSFLDPVIQDRAQIPEGIIVDFERLDDKNGQTFERPFLRSEDRDLLLNFLEGKIPETHTVNLEEFVNRETLNRTYRTYILKKTAFITGDMLEDARTQINQQWNRPEVGLTFNARGTDIFRRVTTEHTKERLAIVLDGNVYSAPRISEPIPNGRARITLGSFLDSSELSRQAHDLAIVLRAGSLKAPVEILEERTIGPTLGTDSIRRGSIAMMIGGLAIIVFMLIYYELGGLIANVALILNGLFILATLVLFQATLTLPGIAGLILTAGMAVDANVIIFERIREELRSGKDVVESVQGGYDRAWWTVFDANITTAIAGLVLMQYGTGPIKGFAVTLLVGILFSFITAVYVTRIIFNFILEKWDPKSLRI